MRRVPDILPVRLQDLLHRGQSGVRKQEALIRQFRNNGLDIILDVNSAAVHLVDEMTAGVVHVLTEEKEAFGPGELLEDARAQRVTERMSGQADAGEIREILEELDGLIRQGRLFAEDPYEALVPKVMANKTVVKALCLNVAHDCNLACKYCFAGEGEYHGDRGIMTAEIGKKALDFLVRASGTRRNLEVDFFGGEPLLAFEAIKEIVAYGRELEKEHDKVFRFTMTTNGVLLSPEVEAFCDREIHNVVLSLDGRKEVNDRMRPFPNGSGSYDLITPKLLSMARSRGNKQYFIRGTFTHQNLDFVEDILHFYDLGFRSISMEPVVTDDERYAITEADVPVIKEQYDRLVREMRARAEANDPFTFFHFMIDLEGGPCVYKRMSGCGAGTEYLAVTPWGDLYPCHQFVGQEEFRMGDVEQGITAPEVGERFRSVNLYTKASCKDCFAKFYCGGGCAANAYHCSGRLDGDYEIGCELERKRVECAIALKAFGSEETRK